MTIDYDMFDAVDKALKKNSTDFWLNRAKEIEKRGVMMSQRQSQLVESLDRDKSGGISMSNFYWGEEVGGNDTPESHELRVEAKPKDDGTLAVDGPESTEFPQIPNADYDDSHDSSDVTIDFDVNRGIKIEIDGNVGYIPHDQIREFIDFAENALSSIGDDDEGDEDADEHGTDDDDSDEPDMMSFLENR